MSAQIKPLSNTTFTSTSDRDESELRNRFDEMAVIAARLLLEIRRVRSTVASDDEGYFQGVPAETVPGANSDCGIDFYEEIERYEAELITNALDLTFGNQRRAAKLLGLKTTTLNAKIKHLGIYAAVLIAKRPSKKDLIHFPGSRAR